MRKTILSFLFILSVIFNMSCADVKLGSANLGSAKSLEERLKEEDLDSYEADHSMENQMRDLIKEYVQDNELLRQIFNWVYTKRCFKTRKFRNIKKIS